MCILTVIVIRSIAIAIIIAIKTHWAIKGGNDQKEKAMGRPPVAHHLKRDKRLVVMLTEMEMSALTEAAKASGAATVSDWVRDLLLASANAKGE